MQHGDQGIIVKALGDETVVWFEPANNYLLMKAPAYSVWVLLQGGMSVSKAAGWFASRYKLSGIEAKKFVVEIDRVIKQQNRKKGGLNPVEGSLISCPQEFHSVRQYKFRGACFCFRYETVEIELLFHPLIKHLETGHISGGAHYYLYRLGEKFVLQNTRGVIGQWEADDIHSFKGKLFMELLNNAYQMQEEDWMCVLHAAAVCYGESCLLFTGQSGCGKSTLTALLLANGFYLLADDFVPVEARTGHVMHFPAAISVKESATALLAALYPELGEAKIYRDTAPNKTVRYLSPLGKQAIDKHGFPVKALIFTKYEENSGFSLKLLPHGMAFRNLIPDSWLSPLSGNVKRFLDWFAEMPCYQMVYSDNSKMVSAVEKLFKSGL